MSPKGVGNLKDNLECESFLNFAILLFLFSSFGKSSKKCKKTKASATAKEIYVLTGNNQAMK
jgi:hypothetical protein